MFISILIITLAFSFCLQILVIIQYLSTKGSSYYNIFLGTFVINTILMIVTFYQLVKNPAAFYKIDLNFISWVISGFVLIIILFVKINTIIKIYKRSQDPECYKINFFGKKVYEGGLINKQEFLVLFITMPFFLLVGSYFVARLINVILYGKI